MKKITKRVLWHTLLLLLFAALLLSVSLRSRQSAPQGCTAVQFVGEYRLDEGEWLTLGEKFTAAPQDGTLTLRGRFDRAINDGEQLHLLLNHLEYSISVNGETVATSDSWLWAPTADRCCAVWDSVTMPAVGPEDTVELEVRSHHRFSLDSSYQQLLESLYVGDTILLHHTLAESSLLSQITGWLLCALALCVLGAALAFSLASLPGAGKLWAFGLLALSIGGYTFLDSTAAALHPVSPALMTCTMLLCLVLGMVEINHFLVLHLTGGARTVALFTLYFQSAAGAIMALIGMSGYILMYELLLPWAILQLVAVPILLGCCVRELAVKRLWRDLPLTCVFALLLCALAELIGLFFPAWSSGLLVKSVSPILLLVLLVAGLRWLVKNQHTVQQVETLAADLENSRILMAMNQIRTHFIFNVLNAISGMCKYDPEKADRTVVRFARFLRSNIDIMQSDVPVTFNAALRHLEDYIALEQVRFGSRINFVTDIEEDYFCLPPLVLQPLVENAIKHGLTPVPEGGTITLRTWVEGNDVCVSVHDDGVGYDTTLPNRTEAVGLQNVRFRLKHVMNGSLTMESAPGQGTTATIRVPLEEAVKCM